MTLKKRKQPSSNRVTRLLTVVALVVISTLVQLTQANIACEGVSFMPSQMVITRAKDQPGLAVSDKKASGGDKTQGLVDVHSFGHFYTFQVDRDVNEKNEGVIMDLVTPFEKAATNEGFAFRLRAEFNSAEASRTGMGFRVVLASKESTADGGYYLNDIAEATSLNTAEGEGTVAIDVPSLPAGQAYQLRYEFGQKEVIKNTESLSMEEDVTASGDAVVNCNLPYFTQELVLIDRKALQARVRKYKQEPDEREFDIAKHEICDFSLIDGESQQGEFGLSCNQHYFNYSISNKKPSQVYAIDHGVDEYGFALKTIAQYPIRVAGANGEPITQLFKMTVGSEFAISAGFRAILRRTDGGIVSEFENAHPFDCLLDQSCQFAWRNQKNHQSFQVVLTTGDYVLQLMDLSQDSFTQWLIEDLQLTQAPFTVYIESMPILQNEARQHCPYMFLMEEFIQQKFIDGQSGQKFHFQDKIIMNLYDLKAQVLIQPELDSHLKVIIREAFGVNTQIQLCSHGPNDELDCFMKGEQIGTTEILFFEELKQDVQYSILLDYSHSILAFHKFDVCPHLPIEISMISTSEAEMINQVHHEILGQTDKTSRSKLKDIFKRLSYPQKMNIDDPVTEGSFTLTSRSERDFEVLYSHDFAVELKMGIFIEIFYSPYDDEVLELFLGERHGSINLQADLNDDYDNTDKGNLKEFSLNKYKSSKSIWVDLEPGEYTIQILMLRHASKTAKSYYEKVNFQLYLKYDFVNVPREAFLPSSLNYHGLLGVGDETHDYGHVTLFWDDLTLWHKSVTTVFQVQSQMTSVSIQLEQETSLVMLRLTKFENNDWVLVDAASYPDFTAAKRIDTVEAFNIDPNALYKVEIFKDSYSEHEQIEDVEMGERYGIEFSLKIDFSEFDDKAIADNLQKRVKDFLPHTIDQVAKTKRSILGLNEKAFTMGNRNMIHLIEYGDGWQEMTLIPSYVPKDKRIFVAKQTDEQIVLSLPFQVDGEGDSIYAGIYEYTQGVHQMSLHVYDDEKHEEIAVSNQGKYYTQLQLEFLPPGLYYLVIKNDRSGVHGSVRQAPLMFTLDVVLHTIPEEENWMDHQLETIQLCQLPKMPDQGLSTPGYVHPLSGLSMQTILDVGIMTLDSGSHTHFTLVEDSLVTVYVETPEDVPVALSISETGGMRKSVALSTDQDRTQSNFLKQEGFSDRNVVQLREFLAAGSYWISAKSINDDVLMNMDQRKSFCETFKMVITMHPTKSADQMFHQDVEEEFCEDMDPLVNQLKTNTMVRGNLVKELTKYGAEVGYFNFENSDEEGPFMVYFDLDYDLSQEGVVAVVLSQYDADYSKFTEIALYSVSDSQTVVFQIVERGTYSISIQSIVSTPQKFNQIGLSKQKLHSQPMLNSHCFRAVYYYMIASVNEHDNFMGNQVSGLAKENRVRIMETLDDMRDLRQFQACHHNDMPKVFPISDEGFEREYVFKMSHGMRQVIDLIVEEPSFVRIVINQKKEHHRVHAILHGPGGLDDGDHPIAQTDAQGKSLLIAIEPSKKPYIVEIIHESFDTNDACPVYDFHIAVKPLRYVVHENLQCVGNGLPPKTVEITEKLTKVDTQGAFSSQFVLDQSDPNYLQGMIDYDIEFMLPHSDFFMDIELKTDFLTGNLRMQMLTFDENSQQWHRIAESHWLNENSYDDISIDADADLSTKIGDKTFIQKLRYVDDVPKEIVENATNIILRIRVSVKRLLDTLIEYQLFEPKHDDLCFNFDLSLFIDEVGQDHLNDQLGNKLIRVDWHGKEQSLGFFDSAQRITAYMQFEKSLSKHLPELKDGFEQNLFLQPVNKDKTGPDMMSQKHVTPSHFRLKKDSDDTLVVNFSPYTLEKGTCYKIFLGDSFQGPNAHAHLNTLNQMVAPQINESMDLIICTSSCDCDNLGTAECISHDGNDHMCVCHPLFTGIDCSQCVDGYYRNRDGFCEKASRCAEHGGEEDCNRHGVCIQEGPSAVCMCDPGFTHDGLDQCSRCADPLMVYPHECHKSRKWVTEQEDQACEELMHVMPRFLHKDPQAHSKGGLEHESQVIFQDQNGVCDWMGRYALKLPNHSPTVQFYLKDNAIDNDRQFRKESIHAFFVRQTSVFHLHLNTLDSGAMVRYSIMTHDHEIIFENQEFQVSHAGFGMITPSFRPNLALDKPFILRLEYEHEHKKNDFSLIDCPKVEVHFTVEPANFHVDSLRCSLDDITDFENQEFFTHVTLDRDPHMSEHKLVLPSVWVEPNNLKESFITFTPGMEETLAELKINLDVRTPGIFSAIVASHFSDVFGFISLYEVERYPHVPIMTEKSFLLDNVEHDSDHLGNQNDEQMVQNRKIWDHLSSIEMPLLERGEYVLAIEIPITHWFLQHNEHTCLDIDLMLEFIPRETDSDERSMFLGEDSAVYIMNVFPPQEDNMNLGDELSVRIHVDRPVDFNLFTDSNVSLTHLCQLQNLGDLSKMITPTRHNFDADQISLYFDFSKKVDLIKNTYKDAPPAKKSKALCWSLSCKQEASYPGQPYFRMANQHYNYCFSEDIPEDSTFLSRAKQCNPMAKAKVAHDGSCICTPPYTGKTCEQCVAGFTPVQQELDIDVSRREKHTACVPTNMETDDMMCNYFGKYDSMKQKCSCEKGYAGNWCEMCDNYEFEYPDCTGIFKASNMQSSAYNAFSQRRVEQVYHKQYHTYANLNTSPFQQQCSYTDYPNFLNQITNHKEFQSGDFHLADVHVVNHDADNVIEWTPRHKGMFKIMLKQPERDLATEAQETMVIEIGASRADGHGDMHSSGNHQIEIQSGHAELDFSVLEFLVTDKLLNEPLLIYFRSVNRTHDAGIHGDQYCAELFMEIEFRQHKSAHRCDSSLPELTNQRQPIVIGQNQTWPKTEQVSTLHIPSNSDVVPFFYTQDFFVKNDDAMSQFDIEVQLSQKFIDQHIVIPVFEILAFDLEDENQFDAREHPTLAKPQCEIQCLVAGHKLYNAFTISTTVPRGTMIRVWLYQNPNVNPTKLLSAMGKDDEKCVNFALQLRTVAPVSAEHEEALKENMVCEHTRYLPRNLNRLRYLGDTDVQQDFDYIEHFRVDNLKHEGRETKFTLKEKTVVRVDGIEHEALQFFFHIHKDGKVVASQEAQQLKTTGLTMIPSIFVVLDAGEYVLKVTFMARESELLRMPCQSIQLQLAMNRASEDYLYPRDTAPKIPISEMSLKSISSDKEQFFQASVLPHTKENGKFQILFDDVFVFEDRNDLNIAMKVNSDFMRADINFIFTEIDTEHHYLPQHIFEDSKKLSVPELPTGRYRIIVFMQNVDNPSNVIFQPAIFSFNFRLFSFYERSTAYIAPASRSGASASKTSNEGIKLLMPFSSPEKLDCYSRGRRLPENLTQDILLQETDFAFVFSIYGQDLAFLNEHQIRYLPEQGEDILRIQIDQGIILHLYEMDDFLRDRDNALPIAVSHSKLGHGVSEMVAKGLHHEKKYMIHVLFASDPDDFEDKAQIECMVATMQVKIASSSQDFVCLKNNLSKYQTKIEAQSNPMTLSYKTVSEKGKHALMVAKNSRGTLKPVKHEIVIKEDNTQLEVTIEGSNHLYGATIQIIPEDHEEDTSTVNNAMVKKFSGIMSKVFGNRHALEADHVTSPKHMTKYQFSDLNAGKYFVHLLQPEKPKDCDNVVDVLFQVQQGLEARLQEHFLEGATSQARYQSKIELEQNGMFKLPSTLPLALDSYRFLGGGASEESYVLFTDYFLLNDDESLNVISLGKLQTDKTYIRMYIEDGNIGANLECEEDLKLKVYPSEHGTFLATAHLPKNHDCKVSLIHRSTAYLKKQVWLEEKVRITILVASHDFVDEQYIANHKDGLHICPTNQWPLALAKNMEVVTNSDEQSYYNYPLIRFPLGKSEVGAHPHEMNTYYFRFNETQRFYFEVGSNFVQSHAILKLKPTQKSFGQYEIMGKQIGNLNVIDTDIHPGDYALTITGFRGSESNCALYSLRGILNMHSAMGAHLAGSSHLVRGATQCEIRNSEEAPSQIFSSELKTRKGNEAVIDPNGNFFHYYPDILVVKNHNEVLEPWTHEIILEVPQTSFLQITLTSEEVHNMVVKVYKKQTGEKVKPKIKFTTETDVLTEEYKAIFKLDAEKATSYMVEIEFAGDMYNAYGEEDPCAYFDLTIAINSLKSLGHQMSCSSNKEIAAAKSLSDHLPGEITDSDLDYETNGFFTLKYPEDFMKLKFKPNGKNSKQLMLPTLLSIEDPFTFSAEIAFDVHMADFMMQLIQYDELVSEDSENDGLSNYEVITNSAPLVDLDDNDDETFLRSIEHTYVDPNQSLEGEKMKYMILIEEKQAFYMFNEVAKSEGVENLCLPFIFKMKIEKGHSKDSGLLSMIDESMHTSMTKADMFDEPHIVDFRFISQDTSHVRAQHLHVPFNVKRISASVLLTRHPLDNENTRKQAFLLAFKVDEVTQLLFRATNVEISEVERYEEGMIQMDLDFLVDFSQARKAIVGAKKMSLMLQINTDHLIDQVSGIPFTIIEQTAHKLATETMTVTFPEDITAKKESHDRLQGSQTHSSLMQAVSNMHSIMKLGQKVPVELVTSLKQLSKDKTVMKDVSKKDYAKVMMTIDSLEQQRDYDYSLFADEEDSHHVKCQCVNGECLEGESTCNKCYKGWKGHMCDIEDGSNTTKRPITSKYDGTKIEDEEEELEIFDKKARMTGAENGEGAQVGRRFSTRAEKFSKYMPRKEYDVASAGSGSTESSYGDDSDDDDDVLTPTRSSSKINVHTTTAADADNYEDEDEIRPSHSNRPQSRPSVSPPQSSSATKLAQQGSEHHGFFGTIFWTFIWVVQWIVYLIIAAVCLLVLKAGCDKVMTTVSSANEKKRKGRKKRQSEDNEDGMGFTEQGVNFSASDDDDEEEGSSPIEMTVVNRKKQEKGKSTKRAGGRKRKDSSSEDSSKERQLELFDQDEEDGSQKAPGGADYNPFDADQTDSSQAASGVQDLLQLDTQVVGHAMVNEIDAALGDHDSDDDGDEFGTFV